MTEKLLSNIKTPADIRNLDMDQLNHRLNNRRILNVLRFLFKSILNIHAIHNEKFNSCWQVKFLEKALP